MSPVFVPAGDLDVPAGFSKTGDTLHVFKNSTPEVKNGNALNKFREGVYQQLTSLPAKPTAQQQEECSKQMISSLKAIKSDIPADEYKELKKTLVLFLTNNHIFQSYLAASLDERESLAVDLNSTHKRTNGHQEALAQYEESPTQHTEPTAVLHKQQDFRHQLHDLHNLNHPVIEEPKVEATASIIPPAA